MIGIYEPHAEGKTLAEWLKDDWGLFPDNFFTLTAAKDLLGEILDDGNIVRKKFMPSPTYRSEALTQWETLRDELLYSNRYFLDEELDSLRLKWLLDLLIADDLPNAWFRARLLTGDDDFPLSEMSAPPKRLASHGRANPAGIPYLYLGSKPDTAVAEVRPHTGEIACIADFLIDSPISAVDLRHPRQTISPFSTDDLQLIGQLRADIPFLEKLGTELTRPVLPKSAAIDYIPSQYLCEFVKKKGFDGVVYNSAVSEGINLALFDPKKAKPQAVSRYHVTSVSVLISKANP
ncbi:MAG TPA: RES family NAD+ phosphorylase [Achromobacter sp.]|uniref:RES family NAD+ phosphorylase n=1 Tax=Achromobacter sp. TaxID=134375 RepID=UPI002F9265CE